MVMRSSSFWTGLGLLLGIGLTLSVAGTLLMYDSGFLLHPTGYVACMEACAWYQYVYPIRKAEYWIGLYGLIAGIISTVAGIIIGSYGQTWNRTILNQLETAKK